MFDIYNRLFGTTADGGATFTAQALDLVNAARPRLSGEWLDLGRLFPLTGPGTPRYFEVLVATALTSGTATAEVEFQLVATPRLPTAQQYSFSFVDGDVTTGTDTIAETAHGMPDGTIVTLTNSGGALPAGLSAGVTYYVRDSAANSFKLALTPGGVAVDITAAAGGGTHTVTGTGAAPDTTFLFVDADVSVANNTITETGHGLPNGTRVQLSNSGGTLPAGLSATQTYFVRDSTANTFALALTPGGAAVDITAAAGGGTHTVTWFPEVLASTGAVPVQRCTAGSRFAMAVNPFQEILVSGVEQRRVGRYIFGRVVVSHDLTAGAILGDLREQPPSARGRAMPSALSPLGS